MKKIGLLGGMSWESTVTYYQIINEETRRRLGGHHSAELCLYSVDFDPIERFQHAGNWPKTAEVLVRAARKIEMCGADFLLICTNTMHKVASEVTSHVRIPLLHIADATAEAIVSRGMTTVGLLGTKFTMEEDFYKGRLEGRYGLKVVVPGEPDRSLVHRVIYDELCLGRIEDTSREAYLKIIDTLFKKGAEGIILGCTEIALLVTQEHTNVPLFDTTRLHALKAVDVALGKQKLN